MTPGPDLARALADLRERVEFVLSADKHMAEVVRLLKNTNETLEHLNGVVGRLTGLLDEIEQRVGGVGQVLRRLDRLEVAALNIERATLGVEAAMTALPKAIRQRITRARPSDT